MQKKIITGKNIFIVLFFYFLFISGNGVSQQPDTKRTATTELKHLWKKNELLIGVGSAMLFCLVVYALWRKKKRSITNIDSLM